jgi:hypothetical protein
MERKRSLLSKTPGGRCCLSFPMRKLGLRPCISMGRRSNSNRTAICSFQTGQVKYFSKSQKAQQSCCRHLGCLKCPEGPAWAGLQEHWRIFEFLFDPCCCKLSLDEAEPDVRFLLIIGTKLNLSSCSDRRGQIVTRHFRNFRESWQGPKV